MPVLARLVGVVVGDGVGTTIGAAWALGAVKAVGKTAANKLSAAAQASPAVVVLFNAFNRLLAYFSWTARGIRWVFELDLAWGLSIE